jgi:hypothetical protein
MRGKAKPSSSPIHHSTTEESSMRHMTATLALVLGLVASPFAFAQQGERQIALKEVVYKDGKI